MKSCFMMGDRDTTEDILPMLETEVERLIVECGVTEFVVGNRGNYDRMGARAVIETKRRYAGIILTMLLPYHPAERSVTLPDGFDGSFYPPNMEAVPRRLAIVHANRYMADHADYLLICARNPAGNTRGLIDYARRREAAGELKIVRL